MRRKSKNAIANSFLAASLIIQSSWVVADRPTFNTEGTVNVPSFELPPSSLSSDEAKQAMRRRAAMPAMNAVMEPDIVKSRANLARMLQPKVDDILKRYPVNVSEEVIAGVPVRIVSPSRGEVDQTNVLINLHGGAFNTCWESCSIVESAPIASLGNYKVLSVNYRMAPEFKHPAGVEDVERVYRELLKSYQPENIGIYGCSAGGALTSQAASLMASKGLPNPAAIGIFGAGGVRFMGGDSAYIAGYIDGSFPPPDTSGKSAIDMTRGYFSGWDMTDQSISPALHLDTLKQFPPSLIITGTRAMDMSPAIYTHAQLLKAGVDSQLLVGEAMGHCYIYSPELPEAQDALQLIVRFFNQHFPKH
jgi:monoterpene epsilon-lactone hydrolase